MKVLKCTLYSNIINGISKSGFCVLYTYLYLVRGIQFALFNTEPFICISYSFISIYFWMEENQALSTWKFLDQSVCICAKSEEILVGSESTNWHSGWLFSV